MKSILLTGGAGYIGSHTAKALAAAGYLPVALDNLSQGNRWAVKWGPLIEGDIRDHDLVVRAISKYSISAVIHFAASASVAESNVAPADYFDNNVAASLALFKALLATGIKNIVFSSTCATYGHQLTARMTDNHPQSPVNPYGESKLFVERALKWYGSAYGLRSVCLRYFNAAGADPDSEIGEFHDPETHLIPLAIRAALIPGYTLDVYGTDYATPDGSAVRDYIHVADLAGAHLRALEYLLEGGNSTCLNLGTGNGYSVNDVIAMTRKVTGRHLYVRFRERRQGDPATLVADASRTAEVLAWRPRTSDLATIIETAVRWHSANGFRGSPHPFRMLGGAVELGSGLEGLELTRHRGVPGL